MRLLTRNTLFMLLAILLVAIFAPFLLACTNQIQAREIPTPRPPEPTPEPRVLEFPADDASHAAPIEWWYYNGHLRSNFDEEYSFHFVIFNSLLDGSDYSYGQAGITDVGNQVHMKIVSDLSASRESAEATSSDKLLDLDLGNFTLSVEADGVHVLEASDETAQTRLNLRTAAPVSVMLHEEIGWMKWMFGWTYYYTYPRMEAEGTLTLDGERINVAGEIWFDHQWGDFFVMGKPAGWQWFAIQLEDGSSIMILEARGPDGNVIPTNGTLIDMDGQQHTLHAEEDGIQLDVLDHWKSPHTDAEYPAKWRLRVKSHDIDITMLPTIADQEVPSLPFGNEGAAYWEGRVDIQDTRSGKTTGVAFVELSGYADPEPLIWQTVVP